MDKWEDRLKRGFDMLIVPHTPLQLPQEEERPKKPPSRFVRFGGKMVKYGFLTVAVLFAVLFAYVKPVREWGLSFFRFEFSNPGGAVTSWAPSPWIPTPLPSSSLPSAPSPRPAIYTDVSGLFDMYTVEIPAGFDTCDFAYGYITDGEAAYRVGSGELIPVETYRLTDTVHYQDGLPPVTLDCLYTIQDDEFIPLDRYVHERVFQPLHTLGTDLIWVSAYFDPGYVVRLQYDMETGAIRDVVSEAGLDLFALDFHSQCTPSPDQATLAVVHDNQAYLIDVETAELTPLNMSGSIDTYCKFLDNETLLLIGNYEDYSTNYIRYSIPNGRGKSLMKTFGEGRPSTPIYGRCMLRAGHSLYNMETQQSVDLEYSQGDSYIPGPDGSRLIIVEKDYITAPKLKAYIDMETMEAFHIDLPLSLDPGAWFFWLTDTAFAAWDRKQWIQFELKDFAGRFED